MSDVSEAVDRLIACATAPFDEDDRELLEALGATKLQALSMRIAAAPEAEKVEAPKPKTEAEWLAEAPHELRSMFERYKQQDRDNRTRMVAAIAKAQTIVSKEDLEKKSTEDLSLLTKILKLDEPQPDFSGRALVGHDPDDEQTSYPVAPDPWDLDGSRAAGKGN